MAPIDYSIKDVEKLVNFDGDVKNVEVSRLTAPGENFLSLVLRVDFEIEKNGHSRTISSVAKRLPMGKRMEGFDIHGPAMKNEIKWYSEIIPLLKDFAEENEIELDFYPKHYGSRYSLDSSKKEADADSVLLLDNLIPQGYQNDDRHKGFDFLTTKAILKRMAVFHALPIAIKLKNTELFQVLKDYLQTTLPKPPGENGPPGSDKESKPPRPPPQRINHQLIFFEKLVAIPDFAPYISKIKPILDKPPMDPSEFSKMTKEPWNTIMHNDLWVNNIMVNHANGKEPLVKIVDFQMCTYGPFAKDLIFFLLSSVSNDITRENLDDFLRFYYEEFTSVLQKAKVDLELTYGEFLEELRANAERAVGHAFFFTTVIFGEKNAAVDVAVEGFDPETLMARMMEKMSQRQKDKLVLIASEAIKRNWI